jgi:hypothetical protein
MYNKDLATIVVVSVVIAGILFFAAGYSIGRQNVSPART